MKYDNIVVAIDLTTDSEQILNAARDIAGSNMNFVQVISVMELTASLDPYQGLASDAAEVQENFSNESAKLLNKIASKFEIPQANQRLLTGHPANEICHYAAESNAQLIVLGSHGITGWKALLGSTANSVVQEATCDVHTVRIGLKAEV